MGSSAWLNVQGYIFLYYIFLHILIFYQNALIKMLFLSSLSLSLTIQTITRFE
jgi:hypothetical protein